MRIMSDAEHWSGVAQDHVPDADHLLVESLLKQNEASDLQLFNQRRHGLDFFDDGPQHDYR